MTTFQQADEHLLWGIECAITPPAKKESYRLEIRCDVFKHHWHEGLSCWVYCEVFYVAAIRKGKRKPAITKTGIIWSDGSYSQSEEVWAHRTSFNTYAEAEKLMLECEKKFVDFVPSVWYWYRVYGKPIYDPYPWRRRKNWWIDWNR